VVSPGVFHKGEKTAIDLLDVRSGERLRLAESIAARETEISTQRWAFKTDAVNRGNQILQNAVPCDLLVIDELGPLEFNHGEGWVNGIKVVSSEDYKAAILVIRPSLIDEAIRRWDVDQIINLDEPGQQCHQAEEIIQSLFPNS
jgi:nucleoside-triphosphatase THEP1